MDSSIISTLINYFGDISSYFKYDDKHKIGDYLAVMKKDTFIFNLFYKSKIILNKIEYFDILKIKDKFMVIRNSPLAYLIITKNGLYQLNLKANNNVINLVDKNTNVIVIETNFVKIYYDCIKNSFITDYSNTYNIFKVNHEYARN
jgi:hypothetical protein